MEQFKSLMPGIEVNGETVLSVVNGMGMFRDLGIDHLKRVGIADPTAGAWYSQQAWLDAFKDISDKVGFATLFQIGRSIPDNAQFPPHINSFETGMPGIDVAYHMNHRRDGKVMFDPSTGAMLEGIGHYKFTPASGAEKRAFVVCENPYPCDFDRGIVDAMARRFKPEPTAKPVVRHDDTKPCRKKGASSCTYIITW
jgi:hypothetical protein